MDNGEKRKKERNIILKKRILFHISIFHIECIVRTADLKDRVCVIKGQLRVLLPETFLNLRTCGVGG